MKSRTRATLTSFLVLVFSAVALVPFSDARAAGISRGPASASKNVRTAVKVAPEVLADTADGATTTVGRVLLCRPGRRERGPEMKDQDARGWFVYDTLTQHAQRSQAGLRSFLESQGAGYQSFWAANMLIAKADRKLIEPRRAADVARIDSNRPARWVEDPIVAACDAPDSPRPSSGASRTSTPRPSGPWVSTARALSSRARTPASVGRTRRSRTTIAAGTA
jgi:hypothetical protein